MAVIEIFTSARVSSVKFFDNMKDLDRFRRVPRRSPVQAPSSLDKHFQASRGPFGDWL